MGFLHTVRKAAKDYAEKPSSEQFLEEVFPSELQEIVSRRQRLGIPCEQIEKKLQRIEPDRQKADEDQSAIEQFLGIRRFKRSRARNEPSAKLGLVGLPYPAAEYGRPPSISG